MKDFGKLISLLGVFSDKQSKWTIFREWLRNDPSFDNRFHVAFICGDLS